MTKFKDSPLYPLVLMYGLGISGLLLTLGPLVLVHPAVVLPIVWLMWKA